MNDKTIDKAQVLYFSHGGGPMPILGEPSHKAMIEFMQKLPLQLRKPDLILVISAHWEESKPTVIGAKEPSMFYDYYGFPEETYTLKYPAHGNPEIAKKIFDLLNKNKIPASIDEERGFDHGLYIPLMLMYPEADIPSLQLSLVRGLDPETHVNIGKALRELMQENILVIGSGFSFHNMNEFVWDGTNPSDPDNEDFQNWLIETCTADLPQGEREKRLIEWKNVPNARYCHPREEHLMPLHVCLAMANKEASLIFYDYIVGKKAVAFLW